MPQHPAPQSSPRTPDGRFGAGNPGRPRGSRNRVGARVAQAILEDFETHQEQSFTRLRAHFFHLYIRLVSGLLPAQAEPAAPSLDDCTPEEIALLIVEARQALERMEGDGALLQLPAAEVSEPPSHRKIR